MKENKVVKYLFKIHKGCDLNQLWELYEIGMFTKQELKDFYYLIGSSQNLIDEIEEFNH